MNRPDLLAAAVSAVDVRRHQDLVHSVVRTARGVFGAAACSVLSHDQAAKALVFEAVAGAGEDHLVGTGFEVSRGIAGWVLFSCEPMVVDDLSGSGVFDRDIAESTGYVPRALMAAPLLDGDEVVGVMEVLDRDRRRLDSQHDLDLLGLFAEQAARALVLVQRSRQVEMALGGGAHPELAEVALLAEALQALPPVRRESGRALLRAVTDSLAAPAENRR